MRRKTNRRMHRFSALLLCSLLLSGSIVLCPGCGRDRSDGSASELSSEIPAPPSPSAPAPSSSGPSPEDTLQAFILAQENADYVTACDLVIESAREGFEKVLNQLDKDDLIATGLAFRQENYQLQYKNENEAVFYSQRSQQYLVLAREKDEWKIDPITTDQFNLVK